MPGIAKGDTARKPKESDCRQADKRNRRARNKLNSETSDKTIVGQGGRGRGTTVSTAKIVNGNARIVNGNVYTAHNRNKAHKKILKWLVSGGSMGNRRSGKSSLDCPPSPPYKHQTPFCQKSGHTEARIMDTLGSAIKGSTIVFNTDWRPKKGNPSKAPCEDCHKMLCYAQENCDTEVFFCDKNNEPVSLEDYCPQSERNNGDLKKRLDYPKLYK